MKTYTIPQFCKSTGVRISPRSYKPNQEFTFKLSSSALYTVDELDAYSDEIITSASREWNSIQKIGGYSLDLFRNVDIRLGYNCKARKAGWFELYAYVDYKRKRWNWKPFAQVKPDTIYTGRFKTNSLTLEYSIEIDGVSACHGTLPETTSFGMGWNLFPFVEYGDMPAIKDTVIGWQQL